MFRKIFAAVLGVALAGLAVIGLLLAGATRARVLEEIAQRLEAHAAALRATVAVDDRPETLGPALRRLADGVEARLTVVESDGRVLADSHADPALMDGHNGRPEVVQARAHGRGLHLRVSDTLHGEMLYLAVPADRAKPQGRLLRVALPTGRVEKELGALTKTILAVLVVLALAGAGVSYLLARWITRPVLAVRDVAQAIAGGDLTRRAPSLTTDELGALGRAMNRMAEELAEKMEKVRVARARLEATFATMEDGVLSLDREGVVRLANEGATALFGFPASPVGIRLWEAVRLPGIEDAARGVLRTGTPWSGPVEMGTRVLSLRLTPVRAGGEGAVLVARDITEDRRYDELRKEFVANASHELRTPLTMIQGYVETLLEGALKDEAETREFLGVIDRNVRRLGAVVADLLDLSRLESGKDVMAPEEVEAADILARLKDAFLPAAKRKKQTLEVEGAGRLRADPMLLERALSNLVDNALKYTPEGGHVRVSAARADGQALFRVVDDGIGIPPEDQPRVFERFYRVDRSRSRDLGGTGLGLAIVKHVAQLHGGDVTVESRPGHGSTFTLRLPQA
jgi:two-component system phosphate regulon sensor histidine kinase PhoR